MNVARFASPILVLSLAAGCGSSGVSDSTVDAPPAGGAPAPPRPWTGEFLQPAVLVAARVRIEGPQGLLDHVVTRPDPLSHLHSEATLPEGYLQKLSQRPGAPEAEIKAQLDQLVIAATQRLEILERPGPVDVVVIAEGDAFWSPQGPGEARRGASLRIVGRIAR